MFAIHKMLDVALPLLALILLPIFLLPFLFFKLLIYVKKLMYPENLAWKVVLITGAATGIGEQLAYEYARRGAMLSLVDIKKDKLEAVAYKAKCLGAPDVTIIGADVSNEQDCKHFVDQTVNHFGHLDQLVNNAGVGMVPMLVEDLPNISKYAPIMNTNLWGAINCTLYAIPHLKKSKGRIIVIASAAGWFPTPKISIYNASKGAVISFFETLRVEVGSSIGITIATPGVVKTNLTLRTYEIEPSFERLPMGSATECAKSIVKSVCRGDLYVTYPSWVKVLFPCKVLYPEVVDWASRFFFDLRSSNNKKDNLHYLSKSEVLIMGE